MNASSLLDLFQQTLTGNTDAKNQLSDYCEDIGQPRLEPVTVYWVIYFEDDVVFSCELWTLRYHQYP